MKSAMLTHGKNPQRWELEIDGQTIIDSGSGPRTLRAIRKARLPIPPIMETVDCWNKEYCLIWDCKIGLWK